MARRKLKPGEAGDFSEPKWNEEREVWQVNCLIGEHMGRPRKHHGSGPTKRKAIDDLKEKVANWKSRATGLGAYKPNCTVAEATDAWMEKFERQRSGRNQSAGTYRKEIRHSTAPNANPKKIVIAESDLGRMKAADVRPFHIRLHLETLNGYSTKQELHKVILNHVFSLLVEDGAIDYNPVASVKGYKGENAPRRARRKDEIPNPYFPEEPCPFTAAEMAQFRELEADHFSPENCRRYRRDPRFLDYTMLVYDLAARPSEALALRWDDVDLSTGEVLINATVVKAQMRVWQIQRAMDEFRLTEEEIVTQGTTPGLEDDDLVLVTYRQPFGKTRESKGRVIVSGPTLAMLRRRKMATKPTQRLVFPNQRGKLLCSTPMSEAWGRVVASTDLEWSTPKTLRSTRATRVAEKRGIAAARLILRHQENSRVTTSNYVPRNQPAVDFADAM